MNYNKIAAMAETINYYANMLKSAAKDGEISEEATDGLARVIRRLEKEGVKIEILDD